MENDLKYKLYEYADKLIPGQELEIKHTVYTEEEASKTYIPNILHNSTLEEIEGQINFGEAREKKLFENLKKAVKEWENQAALTAYYREAKKFFNMKPISHSGNEWTLVDEQADCAERSNAVYSMFYRVYEHTKWDREKNEVYMTGPGEFVFEGEIL